jgi:hypothetical protein
MIKKERLEEDTAQYLCNLILDSNHKALYQEAIVRVRIRAHDKDQNLLVTEQSKTHPQFNRANSRQPSAVRQIGLMVFRTPALNNTSFEEHFQ